MASTITVRNLDDAVKQKLRARAALHGRSLEAEVRAILIQIVQDETPSASLPGSLDRLVGLWKGRLTTDQVMHLTRGD